MSVTMRRTALSTIVPPPFIGISISVAPTSGSAQQAGATSAIVVLERFNFTDDVLLDVSGLPTDVTASFDINPLTGATLTTQLTLDIGASASVSSGNVITITASGTAIDDATCTFTLAITSSQPGSHYFRSSGINAELPRGITSGYDVYFDEATNTYGPPQPLWNWDDQRVGRTRWTNRNTTRTVTNTGTTGWTDFLSHVAAFAAGSGDWEILVPSALTMSGDGTHGWVVPTVSGDRRLYVTFSGTLPTEDVMPTIAEIQACSTWTGPSALQTDSIICFNSGSSAAVTFTGINIVPANKVLYFGIVEMRNGAATSMAQAPSRLVIDRSIINGDNTTGCRRGLLLNGSQVAMLESYVFGIRDGSSEVSGIGGYSCSKYHFFRNVFAESLAIGHLYGGADPAAVGTGACDPSDIMSVNEACTKKTSWMTENAGAAANGMKNGFESKNVSRWFILNGLTLRNAATGQNGISMLFQNLQDAGNLNAAANINQDVVVYNHKFDDIPAGYLCLSRVAYGGAALPANPTARMAFVNIFMENLGERWGSSNGFDSVPLALYGDTRYEVIDLVSWTLKNASGQQGIRFAGTNATNIEITNLAGQNVGLLMDSGPTGVAALAAYAPSSSYVWAGNSFYGSSQYGGTITPGATAYANAAAMGFNTTTAALGPPGDDDGVGGSKPGCDLTILAAGLGVMTTWAYVR